MNPIKIRTFPTRRILTDALTNELLQCFTQPKEDDYAVILSGGNTPLPVYENLGRIRAAASPHLHLTLSDERMVPQDNPQNNARYVRAFLNNLQIAPDRFLAVDTTRPIAEAANDFDARLRLWMERRMPIDLAVLGLGPDGHTASLFSMEDIERGADSLAIPVYRPTPPYRASLTPAVFNQCRRIIILAAGAEKMPMIRLLLGDPLSIPCGRAVRGCPCVELWTDQPVQPPVR